MLDPCQTDSEQGAPVSGVMTYAACDKTELSTLVGRFGMKLELVIEADMIPGSYWGDSEAGLVDNKLMIRDDTPVHSVLHEACHFICMDRYRRLKLDTDAGGDYDEENAVCYLQIILSDFLRDMGRKRMFADMDHWGYTFRLGSASRWFHEDASDAREWLYQKRIINQDGQPTGKLRK